MPNIETGRTYVDTATGQEWTYEDGAWKRAEHPFVQRLRARGGVVVEVDGQRREVRVQVYRLDKDTETFGLALSDIDLLLNADREV